MPPRTRLPHGLTKDPRLMSLGEKGVFGLLAGSIGLGLFQLATSPWGEEKDSPSGDDATTKEKAASSSYFGNDRIKRIGGLSAKSPISSPTVSELTQDTNGTASLGVDDGIVNVSQRVEPPEVNDGVTDIKFGDSPRKR